ncbi:MAG: hypothetical protein QM776_15815 [Rhodocyclaceae bacterium]
MPALSKSSLLAAIQTDGYGYYPYSSEDTFELLRCETTRYSVFRVPVEFVKSFEAFAGQSYVATFDSPQEKDLPYIDVSEVDHAAISQHLKWLDSTDEPASLKFKEIALRGLDGFEKIAKIRGRDDLAELLVAKTEEFYVRFLWFTTG